MPSFNGPNCTPFDYQLKNEDNTISNNRTTMSNDSTSGSNLYHSKSTGNLQKVGRVKAKPVFKLKDNASANNLPRGNQNQAQQNAYAAAAAAMASPNVQSIHEQPPTSESLLKEFPNIPPSFAKDILNPIGNAGINTLDSSLPNASHLFAAMAAAATSASCNEPDDWLFSQFIQRFLNTTKKREAMTEEDLRGFTEIVQQQFRTMFPSGQVDPAAFVSATGQQVLSNICAAAAKVETQQGN